uniref:WAP four-disulfide core domain 2 n=1 Tax=Amphilophus citrinellus TaxID=61819 RepID=A0A3Q0SVU8_AMPCI
MAQTTNPKECPWHPNVALSRKGCKDCPKDHICCVYDGEDVCVSPVSKKPGVCPRRHWDGTGCHELCSNDNECPKNEKCCSTGCGYKCMAPVLEKPGVCPRQPPLCAEYCYHDGPCQREQKHCSTTCDHACSEPC